MQTAPPDRPATAAETPPLPVGQLLAWADDHPDPDVQDQSARARAALTGLRKRHAADTELTAIADEAEQLEKRLTELRAREAELRPTTRKKSKAKGAAPRDYDDATVRAWARQHGIPVAPIGRVAREIVDRWRETTAGKPLHTTS